MEAQSVTTVLSGTRENLVQDVSYIDLNQGSWCITVHSVWCENQTFQNFSDELQLSCNLSVTRISARNICRTPLSVFVLRSKAKGEKLSFIQFPTRRNLLNAKSSELIFFLTSSNANILPKSAKIGIHFTLERFM